MNKLMSILLYISALLVILAPIIGYKYSLRIATSFSILLAIGIFISGISLFQTFRPARYFIIAWTTYLVGIVLVSLRQWGILPENFITHYGFQIGSVLEAILLSVSLIDRIYVLKWEKLEALNELADNLEKLNTTSALANQIKQNFDKIRNKEHMKAFYLIRSNLDKIDCIRYDNGFIEAVSNDGKSSTFELPLKDIALFFDDKDLIRVRKNYCVNPNAIKTINKLSRSSFELITLQNTSIPIGMTYLKKIKSIFPQLFK